MKINLLNALSCIPFVFSMVQPVHASNAHEELSLDPSHLSSINWESFSEVAEAFGLFNKQTPSPELSTRGDIKILGAGGTKIFDVYFHTQVRLNKKTNRLSLTTWLANEGGSSYKNTHVDLQKFSCNDFAEKLISVMGNPTQKVSVRISMDSKPEYRYQWNIGSTSVGVFCKEFELYGTKLPMVDLDLLDVRDKIDLVQPIHLVCTRTSTTTDNHGRVIKQASPSSHLTLMIDGNSQELWATNAFLGLKTTIFDSEVIEKKYDEVDQDISTSSIFRLNRMTGTYNWKTKASSSELDTILFREDWGTCTKIDDARKL